MVQDRVPLWAWPCSPVSGGQVERTSSAARSGSRWPGGVSVIADAADLEGSQQNGVAACVRYLENKREFLHYDQALTAGWPIATGVIEGACRHLIAGRLSVGGSRWGLDGAEAV